MAGGGRWWLVVVATTAARSRAGPGGTRGLPGRGRARVRRRPAFLVRGRSHRSPVPAAESCAQRSQRWPRSGPRDGSCKGNVTACETGTRSAPHDVTACEAGSCFRTAATKPATREPGTRPTQRKRVTAYARAGPRPAQRERNRLRAPPRNGPATGYAHPRTGPRPPQRFRNRLPPCPAHAPPRLRTNGSVTAYASGTRPRAGTERPRPPPRVACPPAGGSGSLTSARPPVCAGLNSWRPVRETPV